MKSYTNLEQSKKLAEILPAESADMHWARDFDGSWFISLESYSSCPIPKYAEKDKDEWILPSWSLAALLQVIRIECRMEITPLDQSGVFTYSFVDDYYNIRTFEEDNAVDAAVEMILKLKEKDLI